jgi:inner membrane protein involved in colicin E2 resistance
LIVGLLIFYGILHGQVTWKDWAILVGVSLVTAAITFLPLGVLTLLVTPVVTLIAALALGITRSSR